MSGITFTKSNPRYTPVSSINRADLVQDDAVVYTVDFLKDCRKADGSQSPVAADGTNLGITAGAFATNSPILAGSDSNNNAKSELARLSVIMPAEYQAGETITVRVHCRVNVVRQVSATIDILARESDKETGISGELCTTAAIDINSATWVDCDFTITPATLVAGDTLDIEIVGASDDTGAGAPSAGRAQIGAIQILLDVKG